MSKDKISYKLELLMTNPPKPASITKCVNGRPTKCSFLIGEASDAEIDSVLRFLNYYFGQEDEGVESNE